MEKIKKSFTKAFLPIAVSAAALVVFSKVFDFAERISENYVPLRISIHLGFNIYVNELVFSLIVFLIVSPFYIGLYDFLFCRVSGKNPSVSDIFKFYRSPGKFFKSAVARCVAEIAIMLISPIFMFLMAFSSGGEAAIGALIIIIIVICIYFAFTLVPYIYAKNPSEGIVLIAEKSVKLFIKYFYVLIAANVIILVLDAVYLKLAPNNNLYQGRLEDYNAAVIYSNILSGIGSWILTVFTMWISFTAVYIIFEKEDKHMLKDFFNRKSNDDIEEETPFIEPYDFFIEADERFNDEKIIETEDIRGVDILAVLDEMELADDIKIDLAIRRKLKKVFEELSFEIGEYVTYEGGREIENDFIEEIDEREFEVSVEITRNSDYEPFKLILRVNVLKEE